MRTNSRTTITIETERLLIIRDHAHRHRYCDVCKMRGSAFGIEYSARIANVLPVEILRRIEARELHCIVEPDGSITVCFRSLQKSLLGG